MTSLPIISIKGISKRYRIGQKEPYYSLRDSITQIFAPRKKKDEFWALRDVSFDVDKGDIVGIIGRNGAGKSTLLKILSRITPPTRGTITMRGRVASLLEVGTGFNPELTGRENISLNGAILGMTKREIRRKFDEIVAFSEIGKFLDTPVKRYSSGMYVRLAFSVAAHLEPEILIVDEVLAVGDAQFQKKCIGKMGDVAKGGRTVLFVSHNMGAVKQLCNRAVLLEGGGIEMDSYTEKVIDKYLGTSLESLSTFEYAEDALKKVQIRRIDLLDSCGLATNELDACQSFRVAVRYDIREDIKQRNYVCLSIMDVNDNCLLQTYDIDTDKRYYHERFKGSYVTVYEFPENLFNQQVLKISVSCGIPVKYNGRQGKEFYFDQKENIHLSLFYGDGFAKQYFAGSRPGYFLKKIHSNSIKL